MTPRFFALAEASKREAQPMLEGKKSSASKNFGIYLFNRQVMERMLPREVTTNIQKAIAAIDNLDVVLDKTALIRVQRF